MCRQGCTKNKILLGTYFDGESGREPEDEEVVEAGKVGAGAGHELYDGRHLLHQG